MKSGVATDIRHLAKKQPWTIRARQNLPCNVLSHELLSPVAPLSYMGSNTLSMAQTSLRRSRLIDLSSVSGILIGISISDVAGGALGSELFEKNEGLQPLQISAGVGALCASVFSLVLSVCTFAMIPPRVQGNSFFGHDKWPLLGYATASLSNCVAALLLIVSLAMYSVATAATGHTVLLSLCVIASVLLVLLVCFLGESALKALRIRCLYNDGIDEQLEHSVPEKNVSDGPLDF